MGFVFFFSFDSCCELSYQYLRLESDLTFLCNGSKFKDNIWFESWCSCDISGCGGSPSCTCNINSGGGSIDPGLWLTYYPKCAITSRNINNHPNGWRTLEAFFDSTYTDCHGKDEPWARPRKCGIHLVYKLQAFLEIMVITKDQ